MFFYINSTLISCQMFVSPTFHLEVLWLRILTNWMSTSQCHPSLFWITFFQKLICCLCPVIQRRCFLLLPYHLQSLLLHCCWELTSSYILFCHCVTSAFILFITHRNILFPVKIFLLYRYFTQVFHSKFFFSDNDK